MDPEYLRWLEIYHPEAIPADRYSLVTAPSSTPIQASSSVVDHFSSVSPVQGANVTGSSTATDTSSSSYSQESHEVSVVAKYLTPIPTPSRPVKTSSGARVLTSEECLVMLEQKQLKKDREAQEKEEHKKKREEKKKTKGG